MDRIFTWLRSLLAKLLEPEATHDPVNSMDSRELADLPAYHPKA